uniref:Chromodomain-helicase-DNA-binding protein 7-like n=1 Tax=Saccoglossus kowalevskii TaxID=10224 RepID=A0ABM0MQW8_SACKO|nr:PREDICTED: chromodomain-helicase-DNA-binding protein 7-like [Saccoglossus kowalevskii]
MDESGRWSPSRLNDDDHVPVINKSEGLRLSGLAAPLKKDLNRWLEDHPAYSVDYPTQPISVSHGVDGDDKKLKKKRKRQINPSKLDINKITGDEKVAVINRHNGRKIPGNKAPSLSVLSDWLERNPEYDVPTDWAAIVMHKGYLSAKLSNRIQPAVNKGGTLIQPATFLSSGDSSLSLPALSGFPSGFLPGGKFPLGPGFPNLGVTPFGINPLLGLAGFGALPSFQIPNVKDPSLRDVDDDEEDDKSDDDKLSGNSQAAGSAAATSTSKTMPYLFPSQSGLFYSPFITPPGFLNPATLASAGTINGVTTSNSVDILSYNSKVMKDPKVVAQKPLIKPTSAGISGGDHDSDLGANIEDIPDNELVDDEDDDDNDDNDNAGDSFKFDDDFDEANEAL